MALICAISVAPATAGASNIAGKVTDDSNGHSLASIEVCASPYWQAGPAVCTTTAAAGTYMLSGLNAGSSYAIRFSPPRESALNYVAGFYPDPSVEFEEPVTVGSGTVTGIDAALRPGARLSGRVEDAATSKPLLGIEVCAAASSHQTSSCATTSASGEYALTGLPGDSYLVHFRSASSNYAPRYYGEPKSVEKVAVPEGGNVGGISVGLQAGAQLEGTVTASDLHGPLKNAQVCAETVSDHQLSCGVTGADGRYSLSRLPSGEYLVFFVGPPQCGEESAPCSASGYLTQFYDAKAGAGEADHIVLGAGATVGNLNAELRLGGAITGKVVNLTGSTPVSLAQVCASIASSGSQAACDNTAPDGTYKIRSLAPGKYIVRFSSYEDPEVEQFYDGASSPESALAVDVQAGKTTGGIDAHLHTKGEIAGTVTAAVGGKPVVGVQVCAISVPGYAVSRCATSDKTGAYAIIGLDGEYDVQFSTPFGGEANLQRQYFDGTADFAAAKPVSVGRDQRRDHIDARLVEGGWIEGVVELSDGTPIESVEVCAAGRGTPYASACVEAGAGGRYKLLGLAGGEYTVSFYPGYGLNLIDQTYKSTTPGDSGQGVAVTVGRGTTGIDSVLSAGGRIAGRVSSKATGEPLVGITVEASLSSGGRVSAQTGSARDGSYDLNGLPSGEYTVKFIAPNGEYSTQTYNRHVGSEQPDPVHVTEGGRTTGIDASLTGPAPTNISAPTITGSPREGSTLSESHGSWTGNPSGYRYAWVRCDREGRNCSQISGADNQSYVVTEADGEYTIRVEEVAVNGGGDSPPASSAASALVVPSPPVNISPPRAFGLAQQGERLSAEAGEWQHHVSEFRYQWLRCDKDGGGCLQIAGAATSEYVPAAADVGHRLRVRETAVNAGGGGAPAQSAATEVVVPPVPVNQTPPTLSGTAKQGSPLREGHGSWTNDPGGYLYRWLRCGADGEGCVEIPGAGAAEYVPVAVDVGHRLRVREIAVNAGGASSPADSAPSAVVTSSTPVDLSPPQISGSPEEGMTLRASHGTWTNEPTRYADQWLRCASAGGECTAIDGATDLAYVASAADVGHPLRLREVASGPDSAGAPALSAATAPIAMAPLRAVAGEDLESSVGQTLRFDGSGSAPAGGITGYRWSFGDGTDATGAAVAHAYSAPGTYRATLSVARGSESAGASVTVTVRAAASPTARVHVLDAAGNPLGDADVVFVGPDGSRIQATSDSEGLALLAGLPDGADVVSAYAEGFRPATASISVSGGTGEATVRLASGEVAATTLDAHEMTRAEIEAAGIDTSDPANQNVFEFEVALFVAGAKEPPTPIRCHVNSAGEIVGSCGGAVAGGVYYCDVDSCSGSFDGGSYTATPRVVNGHPMIQWLFLRGDVSYLKQFFSVSMVIQNLSQSGPFVIAGGDATLNLPDGMSLAPTATPQSPAQQVEDVPAGQSRTIEWIARGDEAGEYFLSADFDGRLEPFEAPVELHAALARPLHVWGAEALDLHVQADSGELSPGVPYHVRVGVTDRADIPLYNVGLTLDAGSHEGFVFQPGQGFDVQIGELRPGETLYSKPLILVPDASSLGRLDPGLSTASIVGEHVRSGTGVETVTPPPLYGLSAPTDVPDLVHLHWQSVPGAESYEVFPTDDLSTPFEDEPEEVLATPQGEAGVRKLPAGATDAYLFADPAAPPRYYAVSAIIGGVPTLAMPVIEATPGRRPVGSSGGGGGAGSGGGDGSAKGGASSASGFDDGFGVPRPTCPHHTVTLGGGITVLASCFKGSGSTLTADGQVRVNGIDVVAPGGIVLHTDSGELDSDGAVDVYAGSLKIFHGHLAWRFSSRLSLAVPAGLRIKGVPIAGAIGVSLVPAGARADANALLHAGAFDVSGDIGLRLTLDQGLSLDSFKLQLASDLPIKSLVLKKASLSYRRDSSAGEIWEGGAEVALPAKGPTLDGALTVTNGSLTQISINAGHINKPIGEVVFLQSLGLKVNTRPLGATGSIGLTAGPQILGHSAAKLDGSLAAQLGSPFVLEAKGTLYAVDQKIDSAWLKATVPGGVAFGGTVSRSLLVVHVEGTVSGSVGARSLEAQGSAKVSVPGASGVGDVFVNNAGIAGCAAAKVGWSTVTIGGLHRWKGGDQAFADSCGFGRLHSALDSAARASSVGAAETAPFQVSPETRQLNLVAHGADGPPALLLTQNGHSAVVEPGASGSLGHAPYLAVADPTTDETDVAIAYPAAGPLRVRATPGAPSLLDVRAALPLPAPQVQAKLQQLGGRRFRLTWTGRQIPGQSLVFQDSDLRGKREVLASKKASGAAIFTVPDDGSSSGHLLRIVVLQGGLIRETIDGPRFKPAPIRIGRPKVTARQVAGGTRISWTSLPAARSYEIFVTGRSGNRLFFTADATHRSVEVPFGGGCLASVRGVGLALEHGPEGTGHCPTAER